MNKPDPCTQSESALQLWELKDSVSCNLKFQESGICPEELLFTLNNHYEYISMNLFRPFLHSFVFPAQLPLLDSNSATLIPILQSGKFSNFHNELRLHGYALTHAQT